MTPCDESGSPKFDALVRKGQELIEEGMSSVVYCGSMGDWPLLSEEHRRQGVNALIDAGLRVIVEPVLKTLRTQLLMLSMQRLVEQEG